MELSHEDFRFSYAIPVRWSDMDEFKHVNNAKFLTYFEECRWRFLHDACKWDWKAHGLILAHMSVDYLRPLHMLDEPVGYAACTKIGDKSFDISYLVLKEKGGQKTPVARGHCVMVGFDYKTQAVAPIPDHYKEMLAAYDEKALSALAQ